MKTQAEWISFLAIHQNFSLQKLLQTLRDKVVSYQNERIAMNFKSCFQNMLLRKNLSLLKIWYTMKIKWRWQWFRFLFSRIHSANTFCLNRRSLPQKFFCKWLIWHLIFKPIKIFENETARLENVQGIKQKSWT